MAAVTTRRVRISPPLAEPVGRSLQRVTARPCTPRGPGQEPALLDTGGTAALSSADPQSRANRNSFTQEDASAGTPRQPEIAMLPLQRYPHGACMVDVGGADYEDVGHSRSKRAASGST